MKGTILLTLALRALLASAHGPKTPEEVKAHNALQESAYHCTPAIAAYTAARKRSWAQKVLGPSAAVSDSELFLEDSFDDLNGESASARGKKILACNEVEETRIRNHSCVLSPVVTQGPYYHMAGHPIRQNMAENELGVLFLMDIGVIDVETCEPLPNTLVDLWHANATGFYAGHPTPKPGLAGEEPQVGGKRSGLLSAYPRSNDHETWLRAAWPTDHNGVSQFTTVFPGFYTGRATHIHVKIHNDWQPVDNGTFSAGPVVYTGQFFFDDDTNMAIDKIWPYSTNPLFKPGKLGRTRNWRDSLNIYEDMHENGFQPIFETEKLGGILQQGLIGYMTVAVNRSASYSNFWSP